MGNTKENGIGPHGSPTKRGLFSYPLNKDAINMERVFGCFGYGFSQTSEMRVAKALGIGGSCRQMH